MTRRGLATALAIATGLVAAPPAGAQVARMIDFAETPGVVTVRGDGAEVTLRPVRSGDGGIDVAAAIRVAGYPAIVVSEGGGSDASYPRWIGIGRLSPSDSAPAVLLAGFTGGAHCCATLKAVVPVGGRLKVLEFEPIDGAPRESFPKDVDGDGIVDFIRQDDSFRYQFSSGAGSFSPPIVFNIEDGRIVDVTKRPAFRPMWEAFAREARARCADPSNDDRNGVCAAYVAGAARLGRYAPAMREVEKLARAGESIVLPRGCEVEPVEGVCPEGREIGFDSFPSALRWFLRRQGYGG